MSALPTYGENLKRLRIPAGAQTEIAAKAGLSGQGNFQQYENNNKFPSAKLVRKHAQRIGVRPEELLFGVVTDYDRARWPDLSEIQIEALLAGISLMKREERVVLAAAGARRLALFREQASSKQVPRSKTGSREKGIQKHRGKKPA